eukprot:XP_001694237.1 predicted protein [Chlamydomonas reinhardtii]
MAAMLRSRAYVAHHGYQRQLRVCTPTRHVAHAGFAEGAAEATGAPNTQPEAAEEVAQLRTKLAAAEDVVTFSPPSFQHNRHHDQRTVPAGMRPRLLDLASVRRRRYGQHLGSHRS